MTEGAVEVSRTSIFASQPGRIPERVGGTGIRSKHHARKGRTLLEHRQDHAIRNHEGRLAFEAGCLCRSGRGKSKPERHAPDRVLKKAKTRLLARAAQNRAHVFAVPY